MAHHKSAIKSIRKSEKVTARNSATRTGYRNAVKKVLALTEQGDAKGAATAFKDAQSLLARAVSKGVLKQGSAARTISRLNARVKKVA